MITPRIELTWCSIPTKDVSTEETAAVSLMLPCEYHIIRSYLEQCDDLAILADVVGITASSLDTVVLASVADTLHHHMKAFRAIGAFDPLLGRVVMRYAAIRTVRFPERDLLLALQSLARTAQPDGQLLQLLAYDLSRLEQKNAMVACSPASDNMGEVMLHTGTCSDDEIERILSSGTSMDQQMMARVLRKIVCNLEEHVSKGYRHFENYTSWFWRLRSFDEGTFDVVLHEWLNSCLVTLHLHTLRIAVPSLVASSCMNLSNLLEILRSSIISTKREQIEDPAAVAIEVLLMILPSALSTTSCSSQDAYRYRTEQHKLCFDPDTRVVSCIAEVLQLVSTGTSVRIAQAVRSLLSNEQVVSILKQNIVFTPDCLSKLMAEHAHQGASGECFQRLLLNLLDPSGRRRECSVTVNLSS
jgi:mediator of RNA polymerase II transcription subunit 12